MKFAALIFLLSCLTASALDRVKLAEGEHFSHEIKRKDGVIVRSSSARKKFMQLSGYPKGRDGFQIDHIVPLKRGGPDCPCNMQWIPTDAKKIKDKYE